MSVIVLAAGQGTRMGSLTNDIPKSLLPFGDNNVLVRLIRQILDFYEGDVIVVVGYMKEQVINTLHSHFGSRVSIIENNQYYNDVNILSLSIAVDSRTEPFFVFESDCVFDTFAMDKIFSQELSIHSSWFTVGKFDKSMVGGILKADNQQNVIDLNVVPRYQGKYESYDKLIGVLKVGPNEAETYIDLLKEEVKKSTRQYYLAPWINNLKLLPCLKTDLGKCHADAFNTADAYYKALKVF